MKHDLRVALINPIKVISYPPLNLAFLAGYLLKYCKIKVDLRIFDINFTNRLSRDILDFDPQIAGVTTLSPFVLNALQINRELKEANPTLLTICGGVHATVAPEELVANGFDIAVIGEGEQTLLKIVESYIEHHGNLDAGVLSKIDGIAFKDNQEIRRTADAEVIEDLDTIPHPPRHLLNQGYSKSFYITRGASSRNLYTVHGARGCPFHCVFCCVNFVVKAKVRRHSPEYIIEEMNLLVRDQHAQWIFFTDDTFFVDKNHTRRLCERIIESGLHKKVCWEVQIRSNLIKDGDMELLQLMKRANCKQVAIGFETFNQRMLTYIKGPGITVEDHHRAIRLLNQAGLHVLGTFIVGTPTETIAEMEENISFIKKYSEEGKLQYFQVGRMQAYPGTKVYEIAEENGMFSKKYLDSLRTEGQENSSQSLNDIIPKAVQDNALKDLTLVAFRRIPPKEKLLWVLNNVVFSPAKVLDGAIWMIKQLKQ
jgi:radical SAM superfamily enzyme YgiQ (UPF0313 family)